ncbi:Zn-ribbon domain-containing OB-fold protein [Arthrobacter sp.]|uniref:Zn-ribbon domain-containing OB-fold protein n=1 Tax=Arthrobacter sp. TaxID=1667 RepID=UPI0026E02FFD|nr:OB-fold domain-containing protein [Arthrobacter sp.]MDO5752104.1 OB-fold domain-containing protein [Arthrobacter sp.]
MSTTYTQPAFTQPLPVPTPLTQPFWDALAEHKVRIQYSPSLGEYIFYPRPLAPRTLADDLEWREISGAGTLYTYTITTRPVSPHFAAAGPMVLAVVQWDEGPKFSTELVNVPFEDVKIGMRVKPVFCDYPEAGVTMLRYEAEA